MMQKLSYQEPDFESRLKALFTRPSYPAEIEQSVRAIVEDVRQNGDDALIRYAKQFDHADLTSDTLKVSEAEMDAAIAQVDKSAKKAIRQALKQVQNFSKQRIPQPWHYSPRPGVELGERFEPMQRIGVYIPGGTAPLVSTVIHTAGIAAAAKVREIVAVTPAAHGKIHPAVLFAMHEAGVTEIYKLGGVYGVAALAYGTNSVPKVEKIVGPGNAYVTAAKKCVYGAVAIDMVAGPSEIMIIGDDSANPAFLAADMLSQAEHGSGLEQAVLVSPSQKLLDAVAQEVERQKASLPRLATVDKVLEHGAFLIHAQDLKHAAEIAGKYAPEHLELCCQNAKQLSKQIKAAGAVFIGQWTPEPIGDFCAGPSHVLPTAGSAKFFTGLTVEGFFRRMSTVHYSEAALQKEIAIAEKFAELEGLAAHGRSASVRRKH